MGAWRDDAVKILIPIALTCAFGEASAGYTDAASGRFVYKAAISESNTQYSEGITQTYGQMLASFGEANSTYTDTPKAFLRYRASIGEANATYTEAITPSKIFRTTRRLTTADTSPWTFPANASDLQVECTGAGGAGGISFAAVDGGSGGGGGAGAWSKLSVSQPGGAYPFYVGLRGIGITHTSGEATWFSTSGQAGCSAAGGTRGGNAGTYIGGTGGAGGLASAGVGDVKYSGGNGLAGAVVHHGGGGGEAASSAGAGTTAIAQPGATGTAGSDGGDGGSLGVAGSAAPHGSAGGGGGGGGGTPIYDGFSHYGGSGSHGFILLSWSESGYLRIESPLSDDNSANWIDAPKVANRLLYSVGEANALYTEAVPDPKIGLGAWRDNAVANVDTPHFQRMYEYPFDPATLYSESVKIRKVYRAHPSDSSVLGEYPPTRLVKAVPWRNKAWWDEVAHGISDVLATQKRYTIPDSTSANWVDSVKAPIGIPVRVGEAFPGRIPIAWTASISGDVISYRIFYDTHTAPDSNYVDVGLITSYTLEGLAPGTWYVTVEAYDSEGLYSVASNEISCTVAGYWDEFDWAAMGIAKPSDSSTLRDGTPIVSKPATLFVLPINKPFGEANALYTEEVDYDLQYGEVEIYESFYYSESATVLLRELALPTDSNVPTESVAELHPTPVQVSDNLNNWVDSVDCNKYGIVPFLQKDITIPAPGETEEIVWTDDVHPPLWPAVLNITPSDSFIPTESVLARMPMFLIIGNVMTDEYEYILWFDSVLRLGACTPIGYISEEIVGMNWRDGATANVVTVAAATGIRWHRNWKHKH